MPCHNQHWGVTYGSPGQHTQTWPGDAIRVIRGNQSDVKNADLSSILTLSRLISEEWASGTRGRVSASVWLGAGHCGEREQCYQRVIRDPEIASITITRAISAQQESAQSAH